MSLVQSSDSNEMGSGGEETGTSLKWWLAAWLLALCCIAFAVPLGYVSHWMLTEIQSPIIDQIWGMAGLIFALLLTFSTASVVVFLLLRSVASRRIAARSLVLSRYWAVFLMLWGILVALQAYREYSTSADWRLAAAVFSILYFSFAPALALAFCVLLSISLRRLRESTSGK